MRGEAPAPELSLHVVNEALHALYRDKQPEAPLLAESRVVMGIEQAMLAEHPDGRISKSLIEPFPNPDDWQEDGMFRVYWDKEPERDKHYLIACDEAKDDFFKLGIQRTQAEVEAHAERRALMISWI